MGIQFPPWQTLILTLELYESQTLYISVQQLFSFVQSDQSRIFGKFEFLFHQDSQIPMYGNVAMYIKHCAVCLKIDYTLRCLEYI